MKVERIPTCDPDVCITLTAEEAARLKYILDYASNGDFSRTTREFKTRIWESLRNANVKELNT